MVTMAAPAGGPTAIRELPRIGQWAFLRFLSNGSRGNFSPWHEAITKFPHGFETRLFGQRCIVLNNPDGIEELLVKNHKYYHRRSMPTPLKVITGDSVLTISGDDHLRQRRLIQPAFHKGKIDAYAATMAKLAERRSRQWQDGATLDVHREMMELTAAVITATMFSSDIEEDARTVGRAIDSLITHTKRYVIPPIGRVLDRLPLKSTRVIQDSIAELDAIIYRFVAEHRAVDGNKDDLLTMLLEARYEDGSPMSDQQLRDESMTLFLAGHETTASALSWTFYLLSKHPHVAEALRTEVDAVLPGEKSPTTDDFVRLDYTRRVFTESMRLYPPVPGTDRQAVEPNEILGMKMNPGDLILVSPMVTHHDPQWYPDPHRFDPDRWLPGAAERVHKFAYLPFGGGVRKCIGERFAWMEGVLILATLVREWTWELAPGARVQPKMNITLRPAYGMPMVMRRRTSRRFAPQRA